MNVWDLNFSFKKYFTIIVIVVVLIIVKGDTSLSCQAFNVSRNSQTNVNCLSAGISSCTV